MAESIGEVGYLAGICGYDGDDWIKALIDSDGHLQIDGVSLALPSGAATAANQETMITALQLIDDLRNALNSVATDELDVIIDGQNADVEVTQTTPADLVVAQHQYTGAAWVKSNLLFGYNDIWEEDLGGTATGTDYTGVSTEVPEGEVWVLQCLAARNRTRAPTAIMLYVDRADGSRVGLEYQATPGVNVPVIVTGNFALGEGATAEVWIGGTQADDTIEAGVIGYKMKLDM